MDGMYFSDHYNRVGCRAAVEVTNSGYSVAIFNPNGLVIETYSAKTARGLARMLEKWCDGHPQAMHGNRREAV